MTYAIAESRETNWMASVPSDDQWGVRAQVLPGRTVWADLVQVWRNFLARRRQRQVIVALSRHHSRLLIDMGFDPEAIAAALENSWDELNPGALLRQPPWAGR